RLHCQLPFISPDLPGRHSSYLPEDFLTLSRTCSMIFLASPSKALTLLKLAGTDIPRQGQNSFRSQHTGSSHDEDSAVFLHSCLIERFGLGPWGGACVRGFLFQLRRFEWWL